MGMGLVPHAHWIYTGFKLSGYGSSTYMWWLILWTPKQIVFMHTTVPLIQVPASPNLEAGMKQLLRIDEKETIRTTLCQPILQLHGRRIFHWWSSTCSLRRLGNLNNTSTNDFTKHEFPSENPGTKRKPHTKATVYKKQHFQRKS